MPSCASYGGCWLLGVETWETRTEAVPYERHALVLLLTRRCNPLGKLLRTGKFTPCFRRVVLVINRERQPSVCQGWRSERVCTWSVWTTALSSVTQRVLLLTPTHGSRGCLRTQLGGFFFALVGLGHVFLRLLDCSPSQTGSFYVMSPVYGLLTIFSNFPRAFLRHC